MFLAAAGGTIPPLKLFTLTQSEGRPEWAYLPIKSPQTNLIGLTTGHADSTWRAWVRFPGQTALQCLHPTVFTWAPTSRCAGKGWDWHLTSYATYSLFIAGRVKII